MSDDATRDPTLGRAGAALREQVRRQAAAAVGPEFRWQRLRAALTAGLRGARVELVDVGAGGRGRGELLTHLAIATHRHLFGGNVDDITTGEGKGETMKRSTKRLLIGVAAGIAVYHFAIAPRK